MRLGAHVSIAGSIVSSVDRAIKLGCNTFQIFTRNPRAWESKPLSHKAALQFHKRVAESMITPVFAHMPYLPNLASADDKVYAMSVRLLREELERCSRLKIPYLVTHLGSHLGAGLDFGLRRLIGAIDSSISDSRGDVALLLENTSGSENAVGSVFEEISEIIKRCRNPDMLGICLDTCHAFAQGYDLRTKRTIDDIIAKIDKLIGFGKVKLIHANDSKGKLGSRIDRHEHIGMGHIGTKGFKALLSNSRVRGLPLIIETPADGRASDVQDLETLRRLWAIAGEKG